MKKLFIILWISCFGCATAFTKPGPDADYGTQPTQYEDAIKLGMIAYLRDPSMAHYTFDTPRKAYQFNGLGDGLNWLGYGVRFNVTPHNSFGGYPGYEQYVALIRNNALFKIYRAEWEGPSMFEFLE